MSSQALNSILEKLNENKKYKYDQMYKVLFVGDSSTSTEWVHPNWREIVEYVVKDTLEVTLNDWKKPYFLLRFINAGLNGGDTREFIERANIDMINFHPDLIIMIGGDNDAVPEISIREHVENIKLVKQMMSENSKYFCFCTMPYSFSEKYNTLYEPYRNAILELPLLENEIFIDLYQEYSKFDLARFYTFKLDSQFEADGFGVNIGDVDYLHPNTLGQAYLAMIILDNLFGITIDPELYIKGVQEGIKYPKYKKPNTHLQSNHLNSVMLKGFKKILHK